VNSFSIAFGSREFDESEYAQAVADRYHTHHVSWRVDPDEFDHLDRLVDVYDEPFGDSSALPTLRVCSLARQEVTVALSGDGGDELFAGYRRYLWHQREEQLKAKMPAAIRRPLFGMLGALYPKMDWAPRYLRAKTTFQELASDETDAYFHSISVMGDAMRARILSRDFQSSLQGYHPKELVGRALAEADTDSPLLRAQYADIKTWLPGDILVKTDRASMAASLEVRAPLLDHKLAEWAFGLPDDLRIHGGEKKYLLKKAFEPLLPHDLLYRPKQGFVMPIAEWFRGPLAGRMESALASPHLAETGFFDMAQLKRIGEEHRSARFDHSPTIWTILMFEAFMRREMTGQLGEGTCSA
jgi:asparagine synthase (glutamine-hydrolysing)